MKRQEGQKFAAKHEATAKIDQRIKDQLDRRAKNKKLPCAVAFKITDDINVSPAEVGKTADLLEIELVKCQLGLFGYTPEKKIVKPKTSQNQDLESAIGASLVDGKLSCEKAWEIARNFDVPKMDVSAACEALNIKITPCQLGAF